MCPQFDSGPRQVQLILLLATTAPDAQALIQAVEERLRGRTSTGIVRMTVIRPKWQRRLVFRFWESGKRRFLLKVLEPAARRGDGTLRVENNLWNYVARFERVIKVPPSMMAEPWMGSDFSHNDLIRYDSYVDDYEQEYLREEVLQGVPVHVIALRAKKGAVVEWLYIEASIRKDDPIPVRYVFFNDRGKPIKELWFFDIQKRGDREVPTRWEMRVLGKPQPWLTRLEYLDWRFDVPIPDSLFRESRLRE